MRAIGFPILPFVVHAPRQNTAQIIERTSTHQDMVPTLMQTVLGCEGDASGYSNSMNLAELSESCATILSSYFMHAYWIDGVVYERTRRKRYAWDDLSEVGGLQHNQTVLQLMEQESRFTRSRK